MSESARAFRVSRDKCLDRGVSTAGGGYAIAGVTDPQLN